MLDWVSVASCTKGDKGTAAVLTHPRERVEGMSSFGYDIRRLASYIRSEFFETGAPLRGDERASSIRRTTHRLEREPWVSLVALTTPL